MARREGHNLFFGLPKNWRDTVDAIFKDGGSDIEAHLAIGVKATDHEILMKNEVYVEHFRNGMAMSEAYWHKWARENIGLESKLVNTKLFDTMMKRFFKWDQIGKEKPDDKTKGNTKGEVKSFADKYGLKRAK